MILNYIILGTLITSGLATVILAWIFFKKARAKTSKILTGALTITFGIIAAASAMIQFSGDLGKTVEMIEKTGDSFAVKELKKAPIKLQNQKKTDLGEFPPQSKDFWMARAKTALARKDGEPNNGVYLDLVQKTHPAASLWFVTYNRDNDINGETDILLKFPEPMEGENTTKQLEISQIISRTLMRPGGLTPREKWRNMNFIFLGKMTKESPLQVLQVYCLRRNSKQNLKIQENYLDQNLDTQEEVIDLHEAQLLQPLESMAKEIFGNEFEELVYPNNIQGRIILQIQTPPVATMKEAFEQTKKKLEVFRNEMVKQIGYIPQIQATLSKGELELIKTDISQITLTQKNATKLLGGDPRAMKEWNPTEAELIKQRRRQAQIPVRPLNRNGLTTNPRQIPPTK